MKKILLSIIIPVYGVEAYLSRFLKSLEKNFQSEIELILVDDGNIDNCGRMIDEFTVKNIPPDLSIVAVHKENGGVSSARNAGLNIPRGKYVWFVDPDDYLNNDSIKNILYVINSYNNLDMFIFNYYEELYSGKFFLHTIPGFTEGLIKKERLLDEFILDKYLLSHLCNKVLRRSLFNNVRFNEKINYMEDYALLTDISINVEKIYYKPIVIYYYCYNNNSLSRKLSVEKLIRSFYIVKERYEKYTQILNKKMFNAPVINAMGLITLKYECDKEFDVDIFTEYINNNITEILIDKRFKFQVKKRCFFVYIGIAKYYYFIKKKIKNLW